MSDIGERLRLWERQGYLPWATGSSAIKEAADEIERLRLQWTGMKSEVQLCHEKIVRLQDAKRRALGVADERSKENVELRAENERLRAAIQDCADGGPCAKCVLRDEQSPAGEK